MTGESERALLSPSLTVSGLVLGLDAIACQLLALVLALPVWGNLWAAAPTADLFLTAAPMAAAALLALWCPAAAALVLGLRSRAARRTGLVTAALLVVAGAALAADSLPADGWTRGQFIAGLVLTLANIGVVALLVTPAPKAPGAPAPGAPGAAARLIDLDAGEART